MESKQKPLCEGAKYIIFLHILEGGGLKSCENQGIEEGNEAKKKVKGRKRRGGRIHDSKGETIK